MLLSLATLAAFLPQGPGSSTAPVVINEFAYDDSSTDDKEFVELFNRTNAPIDLSGWTITCIEGTAPGGTNSTYTIAAGITIAPGGYVVIGTSTVPNLTPGTPAAAVNWLENSAAADGLVLADATSTPVDTVLWGFAQWTAPLPASAEGGLNGRVFTGDSATNPNFTSAQRRVDGWDTNDNGFDFVYMGWTPGAANGAGNIVTLNYVNPADAPAGTVLSADFNSAFTPGVTADPAVITRAIVSGVPQILSIPASPQGGNVAVLHDPTGGGNVQYLRTPVGADYLVECWVYVSGGNPAIGATEGEAFAIGVGTTDSYASPADVPGTYYAATSACAGVGNREPGATGIAWMAYQTTGQTAFYLVDMNNGGAGFTVLGGPVVATLGQNDGWQRLRLRVSGDNVVGNFGGTFGVDDGQRFTATVSNRPWGQAYFQYRECVLTNSNLLPLVIDDLQVYSTVDAQVSFAGTASPTNFGTPAIGTNGSPVLGNSTFAITASGLVPNGFSAVVIGLGTLSPGLPIPGAPATAFVYVTPILASNLTFNSAGGTASQPIGWPTTPSLAGVPVMAQWVDVDVTLPFAAPIGTSQGLQLVLGNG